MIENAPTPEQCNNDETLTQDQSNIEFATWHPQWGGYAGKCIVQTSGPTDTCFKVYNWHDGEFPVEDDDEPDDKHYCSPMQLMYFGLLVLQKQFEHETQFPPYCSAPHQAVKARELLKEGLSNLIEQMQSLREALDK